jgi:zinc/manganese transport system permease protein
VITNPFLEHALLAGTFIAIACGLVGWFAVLRAQVFAADALSHFAFTGAIVGLALGLGARLGLFVFTIGCALLLAALGGRSRVDDLTIGIAITWVLGLGVLALAFFATSSAGSGGASAAIALFGSILGLDAPHADLAAVIGIGISVVMLVIARPLLFSSIDPAAARARGVPVVLLGVLFLVALGGVAAEATQAVGALLLLGLVAAPAGAAHRLTNHPYRGMVLSAAIGVVSVWVGLWIANTFPNIPPSSAIIAVASAAFFCAGAPAAIGRAVRRLHLGPPARDATATPDIDRA